MKDLKNYIDDIDNLNSFLLNQDQKKLIKEILVNTNNSNKENLDNVFQLLIQRVKTGFVFDAAPSVDTKQIAILKKQEKLSFTNDLLNTNKNTLIIGENYDALKNLLVIERQKEQIGGGDYNYDLIYIDPPYNTESAKDDGNNLSEKDDVAASKFIYRDKFSRTGWLNMMNERLKMARQLLKEDGVIFVSIDDNEQAYLKVLMDEIFGEENFVTNFIWQKKSGGGLNTYIYEGHEYILTYALNKNNLKGKLFFNKEITSKKIEKDEKGTFYWEKDWLRKGFGKKEEKDQHRNIFYEELHLYKDENEINEIKNKIDSGEYKLVLNKEYNKNLIARKEYVSENLIKKVVPYTLITQNQGVDLSGVGFDELYSIILMPKNDEEKFKTVKPLTLIKLLVDIKNNKNVRILDFFAGSGTTAHAVMELNRKDGGNRTFTLVTNNENNIGINVCYERLYRINNGKGSKGETDFDWIKKNEPYNQNLDVFEVNYYNTDAFDNNNEIIKQDFKNMLNDFDLSNVNKINEQEILLNLTALKPIEGKDSNESN